MRNEGVEIALVTSHLERFHRNGDICRRNVLALAVVPNTHWDGEEGVPAEDRSLLVLRKPGRAQIAA